MQLTQESKIIRRLDLLIDGEVKVSAGSSSVFGDRSLGAEVDLTDQ